MELSKINVLKSILLLLLSVHVFIHALYLAPINPATSQYADFTNEYMKTFFTQNWHLFAPEPATSSLNLSFRCSSNEEWQHPLQKLFSDHKKFPITARGKQTYVLQHLAREIFNSKLKRISDADIQEIPILQHYLQDQCGRYSNAEIQIKRQFTTDYSKRFENKTGSKQIFKFSLQNEKIAWN